jgi:hypothetical protein
MQYKSIFETDVGDTMQVRYSIPNTLCWAFINWRALRIEIIHEDKGCISRKDIDDSYSYIQILNDAKNYCKEIQKEFFITDEEKDIRDIIK